MLLTSPKDNQEPEGVQEGENASSFGSFFKLVDSIQGLNHLLEDISLDKITAAEEKASQLSKHLADLQDKLTYLRQIKSYLADAGAPCEDRNPPRIEQTGADHGKHSSFTQAAPAPKNLIPFPASARFSRPDKRSASLESLSISICPEVKETQEKLNHSSSPCRATLADRPKNSKESTTLNKDDSRAGVGGAKEFTPVSKEHAPSFRAREAKGPTYELTPTRFKNESDLDRKLKTIIRDYGEVDIYACQTSDNTKKKALIVTLILIIGYFASSLFFPFHQTENAATTIRLQSSISTEAVKQPELDATFPSAALSPRPLPSSANQVWTDDPVESAIPAEPEQ